MGPRVTSPDAVNTANAWSDLCGAERTSLVVEALRLRGRMQLRVHGESMLPTLWPGDIVEIEKCPLGEIRRGDVVLATRAGRLFLHRFLGHDARGFVLRGDSIPMADPLFRPSAFLGRVVSTAPREGTLEAFWPAWFRALGLVLCYCRIARSAALRLHRRWSAQAENFGPLARASRGNA
jgi:hypothetical protein